MAKRNTYSPEFKAKIVIEVIKGEKSISEIASENNLNVNMIQNWKKEFIENSAKAFSGSKAERDAKKEAEKARRKEERLMQKIGHLTVEVDWLKKKSEELLGPDWKEKSGYEE